MFEAEHQNRILQTKGRGDEEEGKREGGKNSQLSIVNLQFAICNFDSRFPIPVSRNCDLPSPLNQSGQIMCPVRLPDSERIDDSRYIVGRERNNLGGVSDGVVSPVPFESDGIR